MIECVVGSEMVDGESGLPHLAHAVCCLIFLMWFDGSEK
ncbi:dATP/dGTP diphosphohydrolase domain-containing protein [Moraxella lacunata]|nr:dATP/dGTP diphosphohydrolase domain-containing protein [Moraxella lacunata]